MTRYFARAVTVSGLGLLGAGALAQQGWTICNAPENPFSDPYTVQTLATPLFITTLGIGGTITYGGTGGPCFDPAITSNVNGRLGFMIGQQGSVHTNLDNFLALTFGMPASPAATWSSFVTRRNGTKTLYGANGFSTWFAGASGRYVYTETTNDGVFVQTRVDLLGNGARVSWTMTNTGADAATLGIWYGVYPAMTNESLVGPDDAGFFGKSPYVYLPGKRPLITEQRYNRATDPTFPEFFDVLHGQSTPFGLRFYNGPVTVNTANGPRISNPDADLVEEIAVGNMSSAPSPGLLGGVGGGDGTIPDVIRPDVALGDVAVVQKWQDRLVAGGQSTRYTMYFSAAYGNADYSDPYTVVVDPPQVVTTDPADPSQYTNNPFPIRVWVDNTGKPGFADQSEGTAQPLSNVRIRVTLGEGLTFVGETLDTGTTNSVTKTIASLAPKALGSRDFNVQVTGARFGNLEYTVTITPFIGASKTIRGTIPVSATANLKIPASKLSLISVPWSFADSSWGAILGAENINSKLFAWDADLKTYTATTAAERGRGYWLVYTGNTVPANGIDYQGGPQEPADLVPTPQATGQVQMRLKSGWNLIGNPFNYPLPIGQIVGVSDATPDLPFRWDQLVNLGYVAGFFAYWDSDAPGGGAYRYVTNLADTLEPNRGYWVFVNTPQELGITFPPIFTPGIQGSPLSSARPNWELTLNATSTRGRDLGTIIGNATDGAAAQRLTLPKPPASPNDTLSVSVQGTFQGKPMRLSRAYAASTTTTHRVVVNATASQTVTLSWPNVRNLPANVRVQLFDTVTRQTTDLRNRQSYSFNLFGGQQRAFEVRVSTAGR